MLAGKPATSKRDWLKAIRHWLQFAKEAGEIDIDVTAGIKTAKPSQEQRLRDVARPRNRIVSSASCRRHHGKVRGGAGVEYRCTSRRRAYARTPAPSRRCVDVATTEDQPQHGPGLSVPVLPELAAAINALPASNELTFLLTAHGRPFASAAAFGNRFADWCEGGRSEANVCDDGKMRDYRFHGLRKAACTQIAEAGATAPEIMAVSGHVTLAEAQKYVTAVEQKKMAKAAMAKRRAGSKKYSGD